MRLWSTLVLIIAAALVAGPAPAPPVAPPTVLLAAQAGVVRLDPTAQCPVRGDFEGQFADSSEMPVFLECVLGGVEAWIDATYKNIPHPRAYYFASHGTRGENGCRGGFDADTLAYCPASQSVYLGEDAVWQQYSTYGDAAPVVVLAHEVTHHFQFVAKMPPARSPNEQIRYENQADCGAGTFMNYAEKQGFLDREDDVRDLAGSLAAAGEQESDKQSHGTIQERLASFDRGFLSTGSPLAACNAFVPEKELIS